MLFFFFSLASIQIHNFLIFIIIFFSFCFRQKYDSSEKMFKRLSKARRHSADDTGNPANQDEPPGGGVNGRRVTSEPYQGLNSTLLKTTRPKCPPPRRSCGDVLSIQQIINSANNEQQESNNATMETDYQMVTAVPAFIVEHEPEKQRGILFILFFFKLINI